MKWLLVPQKDIEVVVDHIGLRKKTETEDESSVCSKYSAKHFCQPGMVVFAVTRIDNAHLSHVSVLVGEFTCSSTLSLFPVRISVTSLVIEPEGTLLLRVNLPDKIRVKRRLSRQTWPDSSVFRLEMSGERPNNLAFA